jgi:hypothetical protein
MEFAQERKQWRLYCITSPRTDGVPLYWCGGTHWSPDSADAITAMTRARAVKALEHLAGRPILYGMVGVLAAPMCLTVCAVDRTELPEARWQM